MVWHGTPESSRELTSERSDWCFFDEQHNAPGSNKTRCLLSDSRK